MMLPAYTGKTQDPTTGRKARSPLQLHMTRAQRRQVATLRCGLCSRPVRFPRSLPKSSSRSRLFPRRMRATHFTHDDSIGRVRRRRRLSQSTCVRKELERRCGVLWPSRRMFAKVREGQLHLAHGGALHFSLIGASLSRGAFRSSTHEALARSGRGFRGISGPHHRPQSAKPN